MQQTTIPDWKDRKVLQSDISSGDVLNEKYATVLLDFFRERNCLKIIAFFLVNDNTKYYRKKDISLGTGIPIMLLNKYILWITKSKYNILIVKNTTFEWHAHHVNVYKLNTELKIVKTLKKLVKDIKEMDKD